MRPRAAYPLSGEEAKSRRAWRLGGLALDCVRGQSAAALSLALSLSSLDIDTYFSHSLQTVRPYLLSVILSRDPPSQPSPAVNLEPLRRNGPFGLLTTSQVASTDGSSLSPPKASRPTSQKTATIPPPPIPPPNAATYWQRPSKRPALGRRSHDTSSARKKKEKQASAETSAENSLPPAPAPITKTSTALVLARTPRRGAEEAEERGHQEPDEALLIEFNRASPPSPTGSHEDLLSIHAPRPPDFAISRSIVHRSRRRATASLPSRSLIYPRNPFQFTRYRSQERSPSSSPSGMPSKEPAWPNPFARTEKPEGQPDPEALQNLTISSPHPTPWKDSRPSRALALSLLHRHGPETTEQQA